MPRTGTNQLLIASKQIMSILFRLKYISEAIVCKSFCFFFLFSVSSSFERKQFNGFDKNDTVFGLFIPMALCRILFLTTLCRKLQSLLYKSVTLTIAIKRSSSRNRNWSFLLVLNLLNEKQLKLRTVRQPKWKKFDNQNKKTRKKNLLRKSPSVCSDSVELRQKKILNKSDAFLNWSRCNKVQKKFIFYIHIYTAPRPANANYCIIVSPPKKITRIAFADARVRNTEIYFVKVEEKKEIG